jgi:hypothetical protein
LDDNGTWTVTDTQIIIPADFISDNNTTAFGTILDYANTVIRSDGNNSDPTIPAFPRQIRVVRSDSTRSAARANAHKFSHVGVGGNRAVLGQTWPTIVSVETLDTIPPPPVSQSDANATWVRSENTDVLSIKGYGLDLAFSIEFVDGEGNLILTTDPNGLPPTPISLRAGVEPSALTAGVTILPWAGGGGADGFEIQIAPLDFGMNANPLFDSIAANNANSQRRVVIRTPFGTAIAPPSQWLWIQN